MNREHRSTVRGNPLVGVLLVQAMLLTACGMTKSAEGAVIFSNLGPGDSFATSPGTYPVWNLTSGGFIERAAAFTVPASQNAQFTSAELGLHLQTGSNSASVKLAADAAGVPGSIIESINISLPPPSATPTIVEATSNTNPTLVAGSTYWVIASVNFPGTMATWGPNNTNTPGGNATRTNFQNGQWFAQPPIGAASLRVNADVIPEPASAAVLLLVGALALLHRPRRRRATPPAGVSGGR